MSKGRYDQLLDIIADKKPRTIVEIGTWDGERAMMMAEEALKYQPEVEYLGFDLFEDATPELDERELNVKKHVTIGEVEAKLAEFKREFPGFTYRLVRGDTRETLGGRGIQLTNIDLAFIDGGHSVETIANDYNAVCQAKTIILDDYYIRGAEGEGYDIKEFGCNGLVESLEEKHLLPIVDDLPNGGYVQMAMAKGLPPDKIKVMVKTKNCVRDEIIRANIAYSTRLLPTDQWLPKVAPHGMHAIIAASGPSLETYYDDLKRFTADPTKRVVCVKSSHHKLIDAGITPWACLLLDPRTDVLKWINPVHPDVIYLCASMAHPLVVEHLIDHDAKVIGYHAMVGSGENDILAEFDKRTGGDSILLAGGSTAGIRGITTLYAAGFRKFSLYGLDSCYFEKPNLEEKTKTGMPRFTKVEVAGKKFWTDGQLLAQTQDFQHVLKDAAMHDIEVEAIGEGMIAHIWRSANIKPNATFQQVFDRQWPSIRNSSTSPPS